MRKTWKRALSILVSATLAVNGMPFSIFAQAEETGGIGGAAPAVPTVPQSRIRFVQKPYSDSQVLSPEGILTMELQVKPDPIEGSQTERTISEGTFVWQTDSSTVIPMTHPKEGSGDATPIMCDSSRVAVVASASTNPVMNKFIFANDEFHGRGELIADSFNASMNTYRHDTSNGDFDETETGLLVSRDGDKLNYYFQYYFRWSTFPKTNADGYVEVASFDFQCKSGANPATGDDALYNGSVTVPETQAEAQQILDHFYTVERQVVGTEVQENKTGTMAIGAFNIIEKYKEGKTRSVGQAYSYFAKPEKTEWKTWSDGKKYDSASAVVFNEGDPAEAFPQRYYTHMMDAYIVKDFSAYNTNAYSTTPRDDGSYEFETPSGTRLEVPRYKVPTVLEEAARETAAAGGDADAWVPTAYNFKDPNKEKVRLQYYISTAVSENSTTSPQEEDLNEFLNGIKWEFSLSSDNDAKRLNDFWYENALTPDAGDGEIITAGGKRVRAKKATIITGDKGFDYEGYKVQVLYDMADEADPSKDTFWMVTPIGVTMDMDPNTSVTYYSPNNKEEKVENGETVITTVPKEITTTGIAPQLHITSDAADSTSYLWKVNHSSNQGQVCLRSTFDPEGAAYEGGTVETMLYKDTAAPTEVRMQVPSLKDVTDSQGNAKKGFEAGVDVDGMGNHQNDVFSVNNGVEVTLSVYDQYGFPTSNKAQLALKPDEATKKALKDEGKNEAPFVIAEKIQDEEVAANQTVYTIKYRDGKDVSSIVAGTYILEGTYAGVEDPASLEMYVQKADTQFSYFKTSLEKYGDLPDGGASEINVTLTVQPLKKETDPTTKVETIRPASVTEQVLIEEAANQWRVPGQTELWLGAPAVVLGDYDVVPGIRQDGRIDLGKINENADFDVSFAAEFPNGRVEGLTIDPANNGRFTYTSSVAEGAAFDMRITATYKRTTVIEQVYHFTFTRNPSRVERIAIKNPGNLIVPAQGKDPKVTNVQLTPYDQYDRQMTWSEVNQLYTEDQDANDPNWNSAQNPGHYPIVFGLEEVSDPLTGVTVNREDMTITVDSTAEDGGELTLKGSFLVDNSSATGETLNKPIESSEIKVKIEREAKRPSLVKTFTYKKLTVVPGYKNVVAANVTEPKIEVLDQYGVAMKDSEYTKKWNYTYSSNITKEQWEKYFEFDEATGNLSVKPCAPNCTVSVKLLCYTNPTEDNPNGDMMTSSGDKPVEITVQRDGDVVQSITIDDRTLEFPSVASTSRQVKLTASGETQYGDGETLSDPTWTLVSITLQDGSTVAATGNKAGVVTMASDGLITFAKPASANDIPASITVTAKSKNGVTPADGDKTLTVHRDPAVPNSIYLSPNDYPGSLDVPEENQTTVFTLKASVWDQYNVPIPGKTVKFTPAWPAAAKPQGVSFSDPQITIDNTAQRCSLEFIASYEKLPTKTVKLTVSKGAVLVNSVAVTGFTKGHSQTVITDFDQPIELPSALGAPETYEMQYRVKDQFGFEMSSPVTWSVTTTGNLDASIDATYGTLTVSYSDAARDSAVPLTIQVTATSAKDGTKVDTKTIKVEKAAPIPSYAVPELQPGYQTQAPEPGETPDLRPVIPPRGDPDNVLTYTAKVYSQYNEVIDGAPATLTLLTNVTGAEFAQEEEEEGQPVKNTATLTVHSNISNYSVRVQAVPKGKPSALQDGKSVTTTSMNQGLRYVYNLMMKETNSYEAYLPSWNSAPLDPNPEPTGISKNTHTIRAEVRDQYGKWMEVVNKINYPVWEFVGEHEGVEFADTMKTVPTTYPDGSTVVKATGEDLTLSISNRAMEQNLGSAVAEKKIQLKVTTAGMDENDENFWHIVTVTLKRAPSREKFLYIEGVGADQYVQTPIQRPDQKTKVTTWKLVPNVYDQYGIPMAKTATTVDMDVDYVTSHNQSVVVVPFDEKGNRIVTEEAKPGETPPKPAEPASYKIYIMKAEANRDTARQTEEEMTLVAEFSRVTRELKVYTECTLNELAFTASCDKVPRGGTKTAYVRIETPTRVPTTVKLVRRGDGGYEGEYEVDTALSEEELAAASKPDAISAVVYDQFGDRYQETLKYYWSLWLRDEEGNLTPYDHEQDAEGNDKTLLTDFLVWIDTGTHKADNSVVINHAQFFEEKTVVLQCKVQDRTDLPFDPPLIVNYDVHVKQYIKPIHISGMEIVATFLPGEYGKLVGNETYTASFGDMLTEIPGIKTELGYALLGWTVDGVNLVDPRQVPMIADTTFVAVYRNIKDDAFLHGYEDKTVRPFVAVTRGEFVKMLVSTLEEYDDSRAYESTFSDLDPERFYYNYVGFGQQTGLISGYENGTFRPNATITRAEAATLIVKAVNLENTGQADGFTDVYDGAWYCDFVWALQEAGIVAGYEDGTFRPEAKLTRAEAAKMIVMVTENSPSPFEIENIRKCAYCPFTDVKRESWAYAYIIRAAGVA